MGKTAVKRSTKETKWRTAKKANVIEWLAEAIMLRDLEQAQQLIAFSPRFRKEEKALLGKLVGSAQLTYKHKYLGYENN